MRIKNYLFYLCLFLAVSFVSCSKDDDDEADHSKRANTYELVLNESTFFNPGISPNDEVTTRAGYYWDDTYKTGTNVKSSVFTFAHTAADNGENGRYWDGMTVSSVNDTTNYGFKGPNGSSLWITHPWGNMTGNNLATALDPYIITFWSAYANGDEEFPAEGTFSENKYSAWVKLGEKGDTYTANSIQIAMHPWTYWGAVTGDGFARPLTEKDDYFTLYVYGVDASGKIKDAVVEHDFVNVNKGVVPSTDWVTLKLTDLEDVNYLIFQMKSSDSLEYEGVTYNNTATYFCLKKLNVYGPLN